jgi:5-methylcytosine-specific restriction endonuclease McrA
MNWRAKHQPRPVATGPCATCGVLTVGLQKGRCGSCHASWKWRNDPRFRRRKSATIKKWRQANPNYWKQLRIKEIARRRIREWEKRNRIVSNERKRHLKHRRRAALARLPAEDLRDWVSVLLADPCAYCGSSADTVDHIDPIDGGKSGHVYSNLSTACRACNSAKRNSSLLVFLASADPG